MSKSNKITVAISVGDTNGIGLEVVLKTFTDQRMLESCTPVLYASKQVCQFHIKQNNIEIQDINYIASADQLKHGKINVVEIWPEKVWIEFGQATNEAGTAAFTSLKAAVKDLASNKTNVLVTAPINKATIQSEDFDFKGHTEYLANYANEENPLMILTNDNLRVALVSGHVPLKEVPTVVSSELITNKLRVFSKSLNIDFGITRPRIAVLGLNPHNGDGGLIGDEESTIITPAINQAQEESILAFGPFPADGFFGSTNVKQYDGVLAMYHDQGLAPFKALAFGNGVNFTAGLPIVRTSPDHGTAFDIAGKDVADPSSFRQAVYQACDIYRERKIQRELSQNALSDSSK